MYEGGHTIAAMIIETVTGTNGILEPLRDTQDFESSSTSMESCLSATK